MVRAWSNLSESLLDFIGFDHAQTKIVTSKCSKNNCNVDEPGVLQMTVKTASVLLIYL